MDALINGMRRGHAIVPQISGQCVPVQLRCPTGMRPQRPQFRPENNQPLEGRPIERLDAKAVDGMTVFDGRVQAYNFEDIESVTSDLQSVQLSGLINFRIDSAKADRILQEVGQPGDYAQKVFLRPSNTALKEITPEYTAFNVISNRDEIGQRTLANLSERMEDFNIIVERVSVENIRLNEQFLESVEAKQIAEQDLARAFFEADRDVRLAEGSRDARITRAEGESQANDLINSSLSEELLQWTYIQRLADNVQLMLVPSDQGLIFDLGAITATDDSDEAPQPLPLPAAATDESE